MRATAQENGRAQRRLGWWTRRSGTAQLELVTHGGFYFHALIFTTSALSVVPPLTTSPLVRAGAVAALFLQTLVSGAAASQALHWAAGRRARPTGLMVAATVLALLPLALLLHRQSHVPQDDQPFTALLAVGGAVLPVVVHTVRARPPRHIVGVVTAAVGVVAAGSLAAALPSVLVLVNTWCALWYSLAGVLFSRVSGWTLRILGELADARDTRTQLAVAEERLRFSRDLHDVMGRNLSVLALKSELATQLGRRGATEVAVAQMAEVQQLAQDAQAEIRAVVRGYRETNLATELAGARSVLQSAGTACVIHAPDDADALATSVQTALGWVVREATTNVLRHAEAAHCEIQLTMTPHRAELTVANDGARAAIPGDAGEGGHSGTGLAGLRERLVSLGGTLRTRAEEDTFVLTATVPREENR